MYPMRLREIRQEHGLSQEQLAVAAGVSSKTVRGAENCQHILRKKNAEAIARVLGVDVLDLYQTPTAA